MASAAKIIKNLNPLRALRWFLRLFWYHPSLVFILLLGAAWGLGFWLFSEYSFKVKKQTARASQIVGINSNLLSEVSQEWQKREQALKSIEKKTYQDHFVRSDFKLPAYQAPSQSPERSAVSGSATSTASNSGSGP